MRYTRLGSRESSECFSKDYQTSIFSSAKFSDTSATRTTQVRHECNANDTSATQMKNVDFVNDTSENIFSRPYTSCMANKRLKGEEHFHSKNYL